MSSSATQAPTGQPPQAPPSPGWYPNPGGAGQRYWDGTQWTDQLAPSNQPSAPQYPPPPAAPSVIEPGKKRPRRLGLRIALALVIIAGGVFGAFALSDYLSHRHAISKGQWRAAPMGASRQHVIDQLGKDPASQRADGAGGTVIRYEDSGAKVVADFDFKGDKLVFKHWRRGPLSKTSISRSQARGVRKGTTRRQIERRFGAPAERADKVTNAAFFGSTMRRTLHLRGTARSRCISYLWSADPSKTIEFCFSPKTGKLLR